ncbi:MAG TPA: chorismate-binding protein, partial [Trueperaceae bacterium]
MPDSTPDVLTPAQPDTSNETSHRSRSGSEQRDHERRPAPRTVPVFRELLADLETPLTAYLKVAGHPSFLLESVEQGERVARYSFIGTGERMRVSARGHEVTVVKGGETRSFQAEDPLRVLWESVVRECAPAPDLPPLWAGAVGYASYDLVRAYERLPDANPDELGVPDMLFIEPELIVVFDHLKRRLYIVAPAVEGDEADAERAQAAVDAAYQRLRGPLPGVPGDRAGRATEFTTNMDEAAFQAAVRRAVEYIHAGDVFQVVPSLRQSAELGVHPFAVYRALRTVNPSPYLGYLDLGPVA